jgi:thiamine pyrophosphate-dependent acetolactate synthase large subunit-like protein
MSEQMTGAQMVVRALAEQGVDTIFGYPGGAVLPIYDALFQQNELQHILARHEQGATHAAEGYARSNNKVGVVLVTSGPGATNAVTGMVDALMDSIPLVVITGQVPTHLIGTDAFQECDTVGITRAATKHNYLVKDVNDLSRVLHEAFYVARSGRPGPVLVDIPKDIQFATGTYTGAANLPAAREGRRRSHPRSGCADGGRQEADLLHRWRHHQFRPGSQPRAARTGRTHGLPGDIDADGPRLLSVFGQALPWNAGDARHLRG